MKALVIPAIDLAVLGENISESKFGSSWALDLLSVREESEDEADGVLGLEEESEEYKVEEREDDVAEDDEDDDDEEDDFEDSIGET